MEANLKNVGNSTVIQLQGRFDFRVHHVFRDAVDSALAGTATAIQVDFGGVDYLDSSALGLLLMLRDKSKSAGRKVSLANCTGAVKQALDIGNFGSLFAIN